MGLRSREGADLYPSRSEGYLCLEPLHAHRQGQDCDYRTRPLPQRWYEAVLTPPPCPRSHLSQAKPTVRPLPPPSEPPNPSQTGLCFSVQPGVQIPPSLRNIYKELASEYASFVAPSHGNLVSYAKSGVLLLNTSLTVRAHTAGSHSKKGWEEFTDRVVQLVDQFGGSDGVGDKGNGVVFLAWGKWAEKRVEKLDKVRFWASCDACEVLIVRRRSI